MRLPYRATIFNIAGGEPATLWKNGIASILAGGYSYAYDVAVSGDDVYVAGWAPNSSGNVYLSVATLWKNGVASPLSDGLTKAQANSVAVSGRDVYVVGYVTNSAGNSVATVWKNGVASSLSDGKANANATSIVIK